MWRWKGWPGFALWAVAGGLLFLSLLTGLSIGLFILPLAVVAIVVAALRARGWREAVGGVAGIGAVCLVIAFQSRDYNPCPESGVLTVPPGDTSIECGGVDATPWLIVGIALVSVSVLAYVFIRARASRAIADPS